MLIDKIRGGIFGVAVGDALGATLEQMTQEDILEIYGRHTEITGGGWLSLKPGEFTDDTRMTLAVAQGLITNSGDPQHEIGIKFIEWFNTKPKDIGTTTRIALCSFIETGSWSKSAAKTRELLNNRVCGNGCLMRTLPITFAYLNDLPRMSLISRQTAAMTHPDIEAELCCAFYNRFAAFLVDGEDKRKAFDRALNDLKPILTSPGERDLYMLLSSAPFLCLSGLRSSGYVIDTLIASIVAFLQFDSFEEIVVEAVNLGGDADTLGATAGGLAGTYYGFGAIPQRWLDRLQEKEILEEAVQGLSRLAGC